jgi:hypothetical protein
VLVTSPWLLRPYLPPTPTFPATCDSTGRCAVARDRFLRQYFVRRKDRAFALYPVSPAQRTYSGSALNARPRSGVPRSSGRSRVCDVLRLHRRRGSTPVATLRCPYRDCTHPTGSDAGQPAVRQRSRQLVDPTRRPAIRKTEATFYASASRRFDHEVRTETCCTPVFSDERRWLPGRRRNTGDAAHTRARAALRSINVCTCDPRRTLLISGQSRDRRICWAGNRWPDKSVAERFRQVEGELR